MKLPNHANFIFMRARNDRAIAVAMSYLPKVIEAVSYRLRRRRLAFSTFGRFGCEPYVQQARKIILKSYRLMLKVRRGPCSRRSSSLSTICLAVSIVMMCCH